MIVCQNFSKLYSQVKTIYIRNEHESMMYVRIFGTLSCKFNLLQEI